MSERAPADRDVHTKRSWAPWCEDEPRWETLIGSAKNVMACQMKTTPWLLEAVKTIRQAQQASDADAVRVLRAAGFQGSAVGSYVPSTLWTKSLDTNHVSVEAHLTKPSNMGAIMVDGLLVAVIDKAGSVTQQTPSKNIEALVAALRPTPRSSTAPRFPRKRTAMADAEHWTTTKYEHVCEYMRLRDVTPGRKKKPTPAPQFDGDAKKDAKQIATALDAYMKHAALVAPTVPLRVAHQAPMVLWRGVQFSSENDRSVPKAGHTVVSNKLKGCYTSFTLDRNMAHWFAHGRGLGGPPGYLIRLQTDRIARGTPWIWFLDGDDFTDVQNNPVPPRWKNVLTSAFPIEREVLLPPGYFKVLSVSNAPLKAPVVDVAFVPLARYLRRGVVPRLNRQGKVVTKTTAGHHLVLNHANLKANVKRRLALVAKVSGTQTMVSKAATKAASRAAYSLRPRRV